jgi:hypothetical protein
MTGITTCFSIIILKANGLNAPIKRHRVVYWIKKQDPNIFFYKKYTSLANTSMGLKCNDGKRFFQ